MILGRAGELTVEADEHGWIARFPGAAAVSPADWPRSWLTHPRAWQLAWQLGCLIEDGTAVIDGNTLRISYTAFDRLLEQGFTLPLLWSEWSPLSLEITMHGVPEDVDCRFSVRCFLGDLAVAADRCGRYVQRSATGHTWLLDDSTWQLMERIGRRANSPYSWPEIAWVRELCREVCATTAGFIADHEILFPPSLGALRRWRGENRLTFATRDRWVHICMDDEQIASLSARSLLESTESEPVRKFAGRLGCRTAILNGKPALVPVRSCSHTGSEVTRAARMQAALGCYFSLRGYKVILTSIGCRTGASLLAVRDDSVLVALIESPPLNDEMLRKAVRSRAELRRLAAADYELLIALRGTCPDTAKYQAEAQGITIRDVHDVSDMIDSGEITEEAIAAAALNRAVSTGDTVERLRAALTGS